MSSSEASRTKASASALVRSTRASAAASHACLAFSAGAAAAGREAVAARGGGMVASTIGPHAGLFLLFNDDGVCEVCAYRKRPVSSAAKHFEVRATAHYPLICSGATICTARIPCEDAKLVRSVA